MLRLQETKISFISAAKLKRDKKGVLQDKKYLVGLMGIFINSGGEAKALISL